MAFVYILPFHWMKKYAIFYKLFGTARIETWPVSNFQTHVWSQECCNGWISTFWIRLAWIQAMVCWCRCHSWQDGTMGIFSQLRVQWHHLGSLKSLAGSIYTMGSSKYYKPELSPDPKELVGKHNTGSSTLNLRDFAHIFNLSGPHFPLL